MSKGRNFLRITRRFDASPERLFDAWTNPEIASKWLFTSPTRERNSTELDPRVGGAWEINDRREGVDYRGIGEYLEVDRPRRLVFTFGMPQFSDAFDLVTVEIAPDGAGALMTLTHERAPMDVIDPAEGAWSPDYKDGLKNGWGKMWESLDEALR